MIVIADKYQYGRFGKTIDKSIKKLVRKGMKVDSRYVEEQNERMKHNGIFYVIDQEATDKWREEHEEWAKSQKAKKEIEKQATKNILGELITDAVKTTTKRGRKPKQPNENQNEQ